MFFGHGTENARDEAAALVFHVWASTMRDAEQAYRSGVSAEHRRESKHCSASASAAAAPLPYLTGEAWFAGLPFHVDERVLVPRSPFAELIASRFEPWMDPDAVRRILEIGTGSGCIAVALATGLSRKRRCGHGHLADALAVAASKCRGATASTAGQLVAGGPLCRA